MKLYQVDAFTPNIFSGNPAGVWIGDTFPDEKTMQAIAAEMNLSETAFVACGGTGYAIRYFSPSCEIPLCGHATLASAHILRETGHVADGAAFVLKASEQDLPIVVDDGWITMTFPRYQLSQIDDPGFLDALVGAPVVHAAKNEKNWIVARLDGEKSLRAAQPDFPAIQKSNVGMFIAATTESSAPEYDYSVRVFCNPDYGMLEDPVTGTAQCVLAPYWHAELKKTAFFSRQLSKRGGEMKVNLLPQTVEIKGQAVTVFTLEARI